MLKFIIQKAFKNKKSDAEVTGLMGSFNRFAKDIIAPNSKQIALAIFLMALFAASNAGMVWLIKPIMNQMFVMKDMLYVTKISLALVGITFIKTITQYSSQLVLGGVSMKVMADARQNLYKAFIKQDIIFFNKNSPGSLIGIMMNDINAINTLAAEIPISLGRDLFAFLSLAGVMVYQEASYSIVLVITIVCVIFPIKYIQKKLKTSFNESNAGFGQLNSHMEQVFNGVKEVKAYNMEVKEQNSFNKIVHSILKVQLRTRRLMGILPAFMEFLGGLAVAIILLYGAYQVVHHNKDAGTFFSFIAALLMAYQPLKRLTELSVKTQFGLLGIQRYYTMIDKKPEVIDSLDAKKLDIKSAQITFENVNFSYNAKRPILKDINFTINPGEKVALVGRSGGGKSTILSLIPRFYELNSGAIKINNDNYQDFTIKSIRDHVALVNQDVVLFDDTIYNNIAYSKENATEEEVIKAATQAYCLDFIDNLPDGLQTHVGTRGMNLSGGQRQRISIARALLKSPPILLLDEATSSLDTESEKKIEQALHLLMQNKTTLVIAHRLSTIMNADKILVIDKGAIIESGTHQELLDENGFYKHLHDLQFKYYD